MWDGIAKVFLALLKEGVAYAIGFSVVTFAILFSPDSIINELGLLKVRDQGKPYLGAIFLVCIVIIVAHTINFLIANYHGHRLLRAGKKRLHQLTVEEKNILRNYIGRQTRSMDLEIGSGVVKGLVDEHIIYRSSSVSNPYSGLMAFAHNIQPWAWDYLNDHRDLLS